MNLLYKQLKNNLLQMNNNINHSKFIIYKHTTNKIYNIIENGNIKLKYKFYIIHYDMNNSQKYVYVHFALCIQSKLYL